MNFPLSYMTRTLDTLGDYQLFQSSISRLYTLTVNDDRMIWKELVVSIRIVFLKVAEDNEGLALKSTIDSVQTHTHERTRIHT